MTENNSTSCVNLGCNPSFCKVYSSAVSVNKYRFFTVIKDVFSKGNLVITNIIFSYIGPGKYRVFT